MEQEVLESASEALEGVAELPRGSRRYPLQRFLPPLPGPDMVESVDEGSSIRTASVPWWESLSDGSNEWSMDDFTEYTLESQDTSVSSTRASNATSSSRLSRPTARSFSVVVRGARSPQTLLRGWTNTGYRGRSVTRRESQHSGSSMRHRHPTHTPSRGPNPRRFGTTAQVSFDTHLHFRPIGRVREE
mmetsp:Transcript_115178/g.273794  ORF Transcript_115178/g.273794 Transcript_115178/m.273794 type:complete len:188 (+) Transcript_115178:73-636(+)